MRIGIQGEPGSFSEEAALDAGGDDVEPVPFRENRGVTAALAAGEIDLGVLPIENSLAGSVIATYDAILAEPSVHAIGEVVLPIHHCVLGAPGSSLASIRTVESHPVALAQCRRFFDEHPGIAARASYDTAGSAREVAQARDPSRGAIASRRAAAALGLEILAANVEDRDDNRTRFLVLSAHPAPVANDAKTRTMLVFETLNRPGALVSVLAPLAERGVNLVKLESRPAGAPWLYRFIIELEHDRGSAGALEALEIIRPHTRELRYVGTFVPGATSSAE